MKRDFELVRRLLEHVEAAEDTIYEIPAIEGYDQALVNYHLLIMHEAGLISAALDVTPLNTKTVVIIFRLTWDGHEFLDATRAPGAWERAKTWLRKDGAGLSFGLLKDLLFEFGKAQLAARAPVIPVNVRAPTLRAACPARSRPHPGRGRTPARQLARGKAASAISRRARLP